jgi:hypothetical protein
MDVGDAVDGGAPVHEVPGVHIVQQPPRVKDIPAESATIHCLHRLKMIPPIAIVVLFAHRVGANGDDARMQRIDS